MILYYLTNISLKFHKDLSFRCGDICKTRIVTTTTNERLGGRESSSVSDDSRKLGNDDVTTGVLEYSMEVALGAIKSDEINVGR